MEITIDTNKDSKEHLRHLIEFLQRFVDSQGSSSSSGGGVMGVFGPSTTPAGDEPARQEGLFGLFGDDASQPSPPVAEEREEADHEEKVELVPY